MLINFDIDKAIQESNLIGFFWVGLKLSNKAPMKPKDSKLDNLQEVIRKTVETKVNVGLWSIFSIEKMNYLYQWGNCLTYIIRAEIQTRELSSIKDIRVKKAKFKTWNSKTTNLKNFSRNFEAVEKTKKEKKRKKSGNKSSKRNGKDSMLIF